MRYFVSIFAHYFEIRRQHILSLTLFTSVVPTLKKLVGIRS